VTRLYSDHSEFYDIAFDWDVGEEVEWLLSRLGPDRGSVLEPGCGTGRILEAFAARGIETVGIELVSEMVEAARLRLAAAGRAGEVVLADMTCFDLGRRFGGAVCPIGTLAHLSASQLAVHLDRIAEHLEPDARYLVQTALRDPDDPNAAAEQRSEWEAERGDVRLRVTWSTERVDFERGLEEQHSRIEIVAGERAGEVIEEEHVMTTWTPATWDVLIAGSRFSRVATYDGAREGRPPVAPDATGHLLWHELACAS
jgi:SAM-dependent methyltransferase